MSRTNLNRPALISAPPPQLTIWSDASNSGWGKVCSQGRTVWGKWSVADSCLHINALECLAVINCLKFFLPCSRATILIQSDNRVVVSLINKQGSNKSNTLNCLITHLLNLCSLNHWTLLARYIPGNFNTWTDFLSRGRAIRSKWTLDQQLIQTITQHLLPEIDLFAHPGNAKLSTFGCLFRHPLASIVDALSVNWNAWKRVYLFPPIDLIPICLKNCKLSTEPVCLLRHIFRRKMSRLAETTMARLAETTRLSPRRSQDVWSRAPPPTLISSLGEGVRPVCCPGGRPHNTQKTEPQHQHFL